MTQKSGYLDYLADIITRIVGMKKGIEHIAVGTERPILLIPVGSEMIWCFEFFDHSLWARWDPKQIQGQDSLSCIIRVFKDPRICAFH